MSIISVIREMSEGLKLGTRYAFSQKHGLIEKGVQPRVSGIETEKFGR